MENQKPNSHKMEKASDNVVDKLKQLDDKHLVRIGSLFFLIALVFAWINYGWLLPLILLIAFTGNNLEQKYRKKE